jgi:hypothetical protein
VCGQFDTLGIFRADEHESVVFAGFAMHLVFEGAEDACRKGITLHNTAGLDKKFQYALLAWAKVAAVVPEYEADENQWQMFLFGSATGVLCSAVFALVICSLLRRRATYTSIREDGSKIGNPHHLSEPISPCKTRHDDEPSSP